MSVRQCEYVQQLKHLKIRIEDIPVIVSKYQTIKHWAYIIHDKDEDTEPHIHIYLNFGGSGATFEEVANWLNDDSQYVCKVKGRRADMLKYLTHKNAPEKFQYDDKEVVSNFNVVKEIEKDEKIASINEILRKIGNGEIRQYNRFKYIDDVTLARNKTLFDNAFKNRSEKIMLDPNRNIQVIFIYGDTGSGKTTYAKMLAQQIGDGSYYVSSSSNDTLQDYKGQETLILDDLRDNAFEFADFLKVLDNHTSTSIKSRYFNKSFLGKCIIITTTHTIFEWYKECKEDKNQFYRRVSAYLMIEKDNICAYEMRYNKDSNNYLPVFAYSMPNPVTELYAHENEIRKDPLSAILNINKNMINNIKVSEDFKEKFNKAVFTATEEYINK